MTSFLHVQEELNSSCRSMISVGRKEVEILRKTGCESKTRLGEYKTKAHRCTQQACFASGCTYFAPKCTHCKTIGVLQNSSRELYQFLSHFTKPTEAHVASVGFFVRVPLSPFLASRAVRWFGGSSPFSKAPVMASCIPWDGPRRDPGSNAGRPVKSAWPDP